MNKIAILLVFACLGAAAYILATIYYPPFVDFIQAIPANVTQFIMNPMETLTQHWQLFASGVTGFAGACTIASKLIERAKQTEQQLSMQKITEAQTQLLGQINENTTLQQTNEQLQTQLAQTKDAQQQIASLNEKLTAKQAEVDKVNGEKNEAERLVNQKFIDQEVQRRLAELQRVP